VDYQSGHEKTMTALLSALGGVNVIYGLGMLESGITFDLAQLVIDNEMAGMIERVIEGIPVTDDTLVTDIICKVAPFGDFIAHGNTLEHVRSLSTGKFINRQNRQDYEAIGKDIYEQANDKVKDILENYEPPALGDAVLRELDALIEDAEQETKGMQAH
jgi:trimethylamine--corrinoid protein Co-methyltransferase